MKRLALALLLASALPPAARADDAASVEQRRALFRAFVTARGGADQTADPSLEPARRALQTLLAGTEPSVEKRAALLRAVAKTLSPGTAAMPPEDVVRDYLTRGLAAASTPGAAAASTDPRALAAAEQKARGLAALLTSSARPDEALPGTLGGATAGPAPGIGAADAAARASRARAAQAPAGFTSDLAQAAPPAPVGDAELRATPRGMSPIFGRRSYADLLDQVGDYVHDWLSLRKDDAEAGLKDVKTQRDAACAGGWANGSCAGLAGLAAAHTVVHGTFATGEEVTGDNRAEAVATMTPLDLYWSVPALTSSVAELRKDGFSWQGAKSVGLAAGVVVLEGAGLGPVKKAGHAVLASMGKDELKLAAKEAAAAAAKGAERGAAGHADAVAARELAAAKGDYVKIAELDERHSKTVRDLERQLVALKDGSESEYEAVLSRYREERAVLDRMRVQFTLSRMSNVLDPLVADGSIEVVRGVDVKELNELFTKTGGQPPFHEEVPVKRIKTQRDLELCQTQSKVGLDNNWLGSWFLPCASDKYFSARQIRDLAALPDSNGVEYIARIKIPAGTELTVGGAAPVRSSTGWRTEKFYTGADGQDVGGGGHGGVVQFWLNPADQGKKFASEIPGLKVVRMAPVPQSHDPALLDLSNSWRESYGNPAASRRVYGEFRSLASARSAGASDELKRDLRTFDGFFQESFAKEYPSEAPLVVVEASAR